MRGCRMRGATSSRGNRRVLFIDDEPALVSLAEGLLSHMGYDTVCVNNGSDGLETLRANPTAIDVAIMDYSMPGLSGAELLRALVEVRADLPIIVCTGYSDRVTAEDAKALGARAYLLKPITMSRLAQIIEEVLGN